MKKIFLFFLICFISIHTSILSFANTTLDKKLEILSQASILVDKKTGTILYSKNAKQKLYPASITKLLTALIVLENCSLDEKVRFSKNAIFNVDTGSSNAGYDVGDVASVNDVLHALLIKSANEAANALAEHCAGSIENFVSMMNEKAKDLGATNSNFANPSGLHNINHYTTAEDFAKIAIAAFKNDTLTQIAGKTYYQLSPSIRNVEGLKIYPHHAMLRKSSPNYYKELVSGKTGYTSVSKNTLVSYAKKDELELISVVLSSNKTHYTDTKTLLDFGFSNFKILKSKDIDLDYTNFINNISVIGINSTLKNLISLEENTYLCVPNDTKINNITYKIDYDITNTNTQNLVAKIIFFLDEHPVGSSYLKSDKFIDTKTVVKLEDANTINKKPVFLKIIILIIVIFVLFLLLFFIIRRNRRRKNIFNLNRKRKTYRRKKRF